MSWRLPRLLNALESWILGSAGTAEEQETLRAELYAPPRPVSVANLARARRARPPSAVPSPARTGAPSATPRPRRRAITRAQAEATQAADEGFQREMRRRR